MLHPSHIHKNICMVQNLKVNVNVKVKVKSCAFLNYVPRIKAYWGSGSIDPHFL